MNETQARLTHTEREVEEILTSFGVREANKRNPLDPMSCIAFNSFLEGSCGVAKMERNDAGNKLLPMHS